MSGPIEQHRIKMMARSAQDELLGKGTNRPDTGAPRNQQQPRSDALAQGEVAERSFRDNRRARAKVCERRTVVAGILHCDA